MSHATRASEAEDKLWSLLHRPPWLESLSLLIAGIPYILDLSGLRMILGPASSLPLCKPGLFSKWPVGCST